MDENQRSGRSHLFLVRLWWDEAGNISSSDGTASGKVQHLISGKASHFSDWSSLIGLFASMASLPQSMLALSSEIAIPDPSNSTTAMKGNTVDQSENSP